MRAIGHFKQPSVIQRRRWQIAFIVASAAAAAILALAARADAAWGVGFRTFAVSDPVGGAKMPAVVFYPSSTAPGTTTVGPYRLAATAEAPFAPGTFPLIVFSHGTGGSMYDEHDLETGLARRGFVVAAVTHAGDNYHDTSGLGTDRVLIGRELQMSALITAVLGDATLRRHIDPKRIGAMGFSAGAYDVLLLAGAKPDFALKDAYCRARPDDRTFCEWSVRVSDPILQARRDSRVRAVVAISPVGFYFDRAGLSDVRIPVDLWAASADEVLPLAWNAGRVRELLPRSPEYNVVPNAHHLVFVSPCTQTFAQQHQDLCLDPPGVDRPAIHRRVVADAAAFFGSHL